MYVVSALIQDSDGKRVLSKRGEGTPSYMWTEISELTVEDVKNKVSKARGCNPENVSITDNVGGVLSG